MSRINLLIIIITVVINKTVAAELGYRYNMFSDPFDLRLLLIDIGLYIVTYSVLNLTYYKLKKALTRKVEKPERQD